MHLKRRVLLVPGIAAIVAAVALAGASFTGIVAPTMAQEPTVDPCEQLNECETPTEEPKIRTRTPTPEPTEAPTDTAVPVTNTPVPPRPTNTPAGGSQGAGIRPPDTGTGDAAGAGQPWLLIAAGAVLAMAGVTATAAGLRRQ